MNPFIAIIIAIILGFMVLNLVAGIIKFVLVAGIVALTAVFVLRKFR